MATIIGVLSAATIIAILAHRRYGARYREAVDAEQRRPPPFPRVVEPRSHVSNIKGRPHDWRTAEEEERHAN